MKKKLEVLKEYGFSKDERKEIEVTLLNLTNNIIDVKTGLYKKDITKVSSLDHLYDEVMNSELSTVDKIYWLMEDCKRYGTLPFAGIARAAFIAVQILSSMVTEEIITKKELNVILNSFDTITKKLVQDKNLLSKEEFLKLYGHLRPGTYDILSLRYDEAYDEYFSKESINICEKNSFQFSDKQKKQIEELIESHGINSTFEELLQFIEESIVGREYAKFSFTKYLSQTLKLIEKLGGRVGIEKEELAYLDYQTIKHLYATLEVDTVDSIFKQVIEKNRRDYELTQILKLPSLIVSEDDIYNYELQEEEPNFVTQKSIQSEVVNLLKIDTSFVKGKIVCIESADPGYDYLFSKEITGLITCYGGANSHMAIRCAELGIPAVIGCGELAYNRYKKAKILNIDAMNRKVTVIQ